MTARHHPQAKTPCFPWKLINIIIYNLKTILLKKEEQTIY